MADDDVTDLTEEGSGAPAKGKKAPKAPKAPKEPVEAKDAKDPKGKKDKGSKGKKEKGGAAGIIIMMLLVLIILIGGFTAALYFDVFSARVIIADVLTEPLLDVIIWLDPEYHTIRQRLNEEEEASVRRFEERTEQLNRREAELDAWESMVATREQIVERRTHDLDRREEQIIAMYERTIPLYRRLPEMSEQDMEDMISLTATFTSMSPEIAATILVQLYDPRDVASILYYMSERNAAAIMAQFDTRYAANITEILLYN